MMIALVVPTIRENNIKKFIEEWKRYLWYANHSSQYPNLVDLFLVEDNPKKTFEINFECNHYCWEDIDNELGKNSWIISKRDSAIRSYGFLKAYQAGAGIILTLDDDCLPIEEIDFFKEHIKSINDAPKWTTSIPNMRTRGLPYENLGKLKKVVLNMGLWENVADLDSIQSFSDEKKYFKPPDFHRIMPSGQYWPLCGMNFAFKREIAVLTYFPLMGLDSPYRRFDDIWFGIILQKICHHLDYYISCGSPIVNHSRASNKFENLIKEAPGIKANEKFWEIVDEVQLTKTTPKGCMEEMGLQLEKNNDQYIKKLGTAINIWQNLF